MTTRPLTEKKITPSDLQKRAQQMIAEGTMPSLEMVLAVVFETRRKYVPQILAARIEGQHHPTKGKHG